MGSLRSALAIAATVAVAALPGQSWAEYNPYKLGESIGRHLIITDAMMKLKKTPCGQAIKRNYNFYGALAQASEILTPSDMADIERVINGPDFQKQRQENQLVIDNALSLAQQPNVDIQTVCNVLISRTTGLLSDADETWNRARLLYGK